MEPGSTIQAFPSVEMFSSFIGIMESATFPSNDVWEYAWNILLLTREAHLSLDVQRFYWDSII